MAQYYTSMQGKKIDMDMLRQRNELTPAVGNIKVNARGDELGKGGKIIKTREQILKDYYATNPGVSQEKSIKKTPTQPDTATSMASPPDPLTVVEENWVEDDDGNFVQKKSTKPKAK